MLSGASGRAGNARPGSLEPIRCERSGRTAPSMTAVDASSGNPAGWPAEVLDILHRAVTAEFATLTRAGTPITTPTTPYVGDSGLSLDISTGLTYPAKAERARRNPKVCLLYADEVGSGLERPPVVMVQGLATVRDADLQANTDRYVACSTAKLPEATRGSPRFMLRRMAWYYARIWIEVTPTRITWWSDRYLSSPPLQWSAPPGTEAPASDPAPSGRQPAPWVAPPTSWEAQGADAFTRMGSHDLTFVQDDGYPACLPVEVTRMDIAGFAIRIGPGAPMPADGPACLTFHTHPEKFTSQENRTFVGVLEGTAGPGGNLERFFRVERALADWSLAGTRTNVALGFLAKGRTLRPRLIAESARRGQPVPKVRFRH